MLSKYSKYLRSSTAKSMMLAFTQSVVAMLFILVDYIFSKKMSVELFGEWKHLYFVLGLFLPTLSFGIPEGFKYYIARERDAGDRYFTNTIFASLVIVVGVTVLIALLHFMSLFGWVDLGNYYLLGFMFPLAYLAYNWNRLFRFSNINEDRVWHNTKTLSIYFVPTVLIILAVGYFFDRFVSWYLWVAIGIYVLIYGAPLASLFVSSSYKFRHRFLSKDAFKRMLAIGFPLYLATFIGIITVNLDKGIVSIFEDKAVFAIFSVGAMEVPVFAMLSAAFSQQIYPSLVRMVTEGRTQDAKNLWIRTTKKVSYITYPMILILIVFAEPLITFLYSDAYHESVRIFQTYLLIGLFRNNYYGALITASGKTKWITVYSALTLICNLAFALSLYFLIGIEGIAYGSLFSVILVNFLQLRHERMLILYFRRFLLDWKIVGMVLIILVAFILDLR